MLSETFPFRFLPADTRRTFERTLTPCAYAAGEAVFEAGDQDNDRAFVVLEGHLEAVSPRGRTYLRFGPGELVGERAALFAEPRPYRLVARTDARCLIIEGPKLLELIACSPVVSQSMGRMLREHQGIFRPFEQFMACIQHGVAANEVSHRELLAAYRRLRPALHPHARDPERIDLGALAYALPRLPENVTRTFLYFLTDNLPPLYQRPDQRFLKVRTDARRRSVYEMMPGKNLVLLRDGVSDLIDFLTCLCVLTTEARKIRSRLSDPEISAMLSRARLAESPDDQVLHTLPFTDEERAGLTRLWPGEVVRHLHEIAFHHEDFYIQIRKQQGRNLGHSERWVDELARATHELMGLEPSELPDDLEVHILSSNTHSVTNCLSPWLCKNAPRIREWGRDHPILDENWSTDMDGVYALLRDFLRAHPEEVASRRAADRAAGVLHLEETAFTGIGVQLIDTEALIGASIDPGVTPPNRRCLLVNIDYAFGQQAEEIMASLIALFGRNLASVNVLGKAGGIQGERGDIIYPTAFLEQSGEHLYTIDHSALDVDRLQQRVPDRTIHKGVALTVQGTLIQDAAMLRFYRHIWGCVGLEMEGWFYFHPIREAIQRQILSADLPLRFVYYVSDLPLQTHANLSGAMRPIEGIPPLYAITREMLSGIFGEHP